MLAGNRMVSMNKRINCRTMTKALFLTLFFCIVVIFPVSAITNSWHIMTVDNSGSTGSYSSLALNSSDYPAISYQETNGACGLNYAAYNYPSWNIQTLFPVDAGFYTSLFFDSSDNPRISFFNTGSGSVNYTFWDGGTWSEKIIEGVGANGGYTSLTLNAITGYPAISYYDATNGNLKYAAWDGSTWNIETVDSAGDVGQYTSLALDTSGNPHISYYNATLSQQGLKYAAWDGSTWNIETVDSAGDVGQYSSLALDTSGNPHISYYNATLSQQGLKYAAWDGLTWNIETVDSAGDVGQYSSLALSSGMPRIAYYDATNGHLKYAAWDGSSWSIEIVDSLGNVGQFSSLKLTPSGEPRISYFDNTAKILKYAWNGTPVVADFTTTTPTTGIVPLTVQFKDISTGNPLPISWIWDFGDGTTSTDQNPGKTYAFTGSFQVSLTASGMYGSDKKTLTDFITANPAPTPTPTPTPEQSTDTSDISVSTPLATPVQELSIATEPVNVGGNSAIEKANVTGKGVSEMVVTAKILSTLPPGVPSIVDPVYQYIDVTPAHFTTISLAVIEFGVPLSWIEEQHTTPASIALARFQDGIWTYLPTTLIREANGHAYFRAESPGFSIFAIVAVKGSVIPAGETQVPAVTTEQITVPPTSVAVPMTTTPGAPRTSTIPAATSTQPQQQPVAVLVPVLGAGMALLLRRLQ